MTTVNRKFFFKMIGDLLQEVRQITQYVKKITLEANEEQNLNLTNNKQEDEEGMFCESTETNPFARTFLQIANAGRLVQSGLTGLLVLIVIKFRWIKIQVSNSNSSGKHTPYN